MSSMLKRLAPFSVLLASAAVAAGYQAGWPASSGPADPAPVAAVPVPVLGVARPVAPDPAIAGAVAQWNALRQSDRLPFAAYASFLVAHPGWPGEAAMRRAAEKAIAAGQASPADVARYFDRLPPTTNTGRARQAQALIAIGRAAEAETAARAAWTGGALSYEDELALLGQFGGRFPSADHDARMERLLWDRTVAAAQRQLAQTGPARRPLYQARLAMQQRSPDVAALVSIAGPGAEADAGFVADRARWMRDTGQGVAARGYMAQVRRLDTPPLAPEPWMETRLLFARGAAADGQWSLAYGIASQLGDVFPAGTVVRDRPFGERDEFTSLAWLAGSAAFSKLRRYDDAQRMFALYAAASKTPQSQAKGQYWAGRAAQAAGRAGDAQAWYGQAAAHYDQFYGQLAAERLGTSVPLPAPAVAVAVAPDERARFEGGELVRAARHLGSVGRWQDQTQFVRAIAASVTSDAQHQMAAQLARDLARPDLGVMVARNARVDGSSDYVRSGFPEVGVPAHLQSSWTMIHSIMRQESQFDREAVSSAGARGMMQLMPGTAREQAGKSGLPFDYMRLTTDPGYNMALGTGYFGRMMDQFSGSYVLSVAAYNAGPGNVRKWLAANGDPRMPGVDVVDWIESIPLSETRGYVQRVLENAVVYDLLNPARARMPARNRLSAYLGKSSIG